MPIYTRRGDRGDTSLADGQRVSKASARVEAYGTVDEANSAIGLARAAVTDPDLEAVLRFMQQRLFNCGASLCSPCMGDPATTPGVDAADVAWLESVIDLFSDRCAPLDHFVLQGGSEAASRLQLARAITRRAERRLVTLAAEAPVEEHVAAFVNRLSDALFTCARYANSIASVPDECWDPDAPLPAL